MDFTQRMFARSLLRQQLVDMDGTQFERFVDRLLGFLHTDYLPVRAHGPLGDVGADGLMLGDKILYACYSPRTEVLAEVRKKFRSDLLKAITKRKGTFTTFRFTVNDSRDPGIHPFLSLTINRARTKVHPVGIDIYDADRIGNDMVRLDLVAVEDLLMCRIPVEDRVYSIGLVDLAPLLEHLGERRRIAAPLDAIPDVNAYKIEFNRLRLGPEVHAALTEGMRYSHLVDDYYAGLNSVDEHDRVAQGFRAYYERVRDEARSDEDLWHRLHQYILGNHSVTITTTKCASIILAHFFERCDLYEIPPTGWTPAPSGQEVP